MRGIRYTWIEWLVIVFCSAIFIAAGLSVYIAVLRRKQPPRPLTAAELVQVLESHTNRIAVGPWRAIAEPAYTLEVKHANWRAYRVTIRSNVYIIVDRTCGGVAIIPETKTEQ